MEQKTLIPQGSGNPQPSGDIAYFCERTGRILREDIKVYKLYIRKDSQAELGIIFS